MTTSTNTPTSFTNKAVEENEEGYLTIIGIRSRNKMSGRALELVYLGFPVIAACLAYSGAELFMPEWPRPLLALFAILFAGFATSMKLVSYGRKQFSALVAAAAIASGSVTFVFDAMGFYRETGLESVLMQEKDGVLAEVTDFHGRVSEAVGELRGDIEEAHQEALTTASSNQATGLRDARRREAGFADPVAGANAFKTDKDLLDKQERIAKANADSIRDSALKEVDAVQVKLDQLMGETAALVSAAENFKELEAAVREANPLMAKVVGDYRAAQGSEAITVPDLKVKIEGILDVFIRALMNWDPSAWFSVLIGFVLEFGDVLVVLSMRYVQDQDKSETRMFQTQIQELEKKIQELENTNTTLTSEKFALANEKATLAKKDADRDGKHQVAIDVLRQQLASCQKELQTSQEEVLARRQEVLKLTGDNGRLIGENNTLKNLLAEEDGVTTPRSASRRPTTT